MKRKIETKPVTWGMWVFNLAKKSCSAAIFRDVSSGEKKKKERISVNISTMVAWIWLVQN